MAVDKVALSFWRGCGLTIRDTFEAPRERSESVHLVATDHDCYLSASAERSPTASTADETTEAPVLFLKFSKYQ
jgi:hypothetical protein